MEQIEKIKSYASGCLVEEVKKMSNNILSGTAMAVLLGFVAIVISIFVSNLNFSERIIVFILGLLFAWLGILFERG